MSNQQYNPVGQPGTTQPMVGANGQVGPGQFPGMQMAPTPPQYQAPQYQAPQYQQPMPGQQPQYHAPQQPQKPQNNFKEVIRTNYTTIALFEVSAGFDPSEQFPKAIAFVMGMPGQKDATKQSGRTYVPANKITMKFSMQELKSLGQMLINLAMFKAAAIKFEKHSDPSKNTFSQNQAQDTKKIVAAYDQAKDNVIITMNWGQKNVFIPVPLQDAFGLGHNLINLGNVADDKLADYKIAHGLKNEEVTGIDYDPAGTEEHAPQAQPQYQQPAQYAPAQPQYAAPQAPAQQPHLGGAQPQYTPEQIAYFQAQQAGANQQFPGGYPGAQ